MISIVITAYNVAATIEAAVMSAMKQRGFDPGELEVIVVEDCSTDGTRQVLDHIARRRHRHPLHILENPQNLGAGLSRRVGIRQAAGDYILTLDGDDTLTPGFVGALYDCAQRTGAEIVSGGITILREDGSQEAITYAERVDEGVEKVRRHLGSRTIFMNNKLIHRRLHDLVPYSHRRYIEDSPTIFPMMALANRVAYVKHCGYRYLMRGASLTHNTNQLQELLCRALALKDIIGYFSELEDPALRGLFTVKDFLETYPMLSRLKISLDEIKPYQSLWNEYFDYYNKVKSLEL